ncbi:MAG: hypothetical protein ACKVOK_02600 [Flavobacteriales bacterium]
MNTRDFNNTNRKNMTTPKEQTINGALVALAVTSLAVVACKKDREGLYELNDVELYSSAAEKDKLKSNQQFISILHTNIFQTSIGTGEVFELDQAFQSIGDKDLAREVLISNFFNESGVQLPSTEDMNADINQFIDDTYKRFFVRLPNEAERTWVKNFLASNPQLTPEHVYFAFAISNEYQYY